MANNRGKKKTRLVQATVPALHEIETLVQVLQGLHKKIKDVQMSGWAGEGYSEYLQEVVTPALRKANKAHMDCLLEVVSMRWAKPANSAKPAELKRQVIK